MSSNTVELEQKFFSQREAEHSLELFARGRRELLPVLSTRDDLSLPQLIRHQHEIIGSLLFDIRTNSYELAPAIPVSVFAGKQRVIHKFPLLEQFLLAHFARCVAELVEPNLPDSLYSFRKGRGNIGALRRVSEFMTRSAGPHYVLRRDIKNFGESLVHKQVLSDFDHYFPSSECLRSLLEKILRFRLAENGRVDENVLGLPTGSYLQLIFENLYLIDLDRSFSELSDSEHIRFGDDILFISTSEAVCDRANESARRIVSKRKLVFHPEKSEDLLLLPSHQIAAAKKKKYVPRNHFDYLGMRMFSDGTISLSPKKQRAIQREIREMLKSSAALGADALSQEELQKLLVSAVRELLSRETRFQKTAARSYLALCSDVEQMKELDRWIALQILALTTGGGFKKSSFRNNSWGALRKFGLPSILHQWRTHGR